MAIEIDARGKPCPLPVIDLAKAIVTIEVGSAIRLLADDPAASADIPAWCRMRGQELRGVEQTGDHSVFVVVRRS